MSRTPPAHHGATVLKTCVVTGASGFIGRVLCRLLTERGARVRAVNRRNVGGPWHEAIALDLATADIPEAWLDGVDAIFHLAGVADADVPRSEHYYEIQNYEATRRLMALASRLSIPRFVFISSVKAGGEGGAIEQSEESPCCPQTAYGRSKRRAEQLILAAQGVPHACVLRLPMVYGVGARGSLPRMIKAVRGRYFPPLPKVDNRRSMLFVDDAARAALLAAESPVAAGRLYIVTDGETYSTGQIYRWICESLDRNVPVWQFPLPLLRLAARAGDVARRLSGRRLPLDSPALDRLLGSAWYSNRKVRDELAFEPKMTLAEALPDMVAELIRREGAA